jgi:signal transduction histidine kinase
VRLIVCDTGHGMDAETLGRATEPFFSTKDVGKGTGLGLSMIHGLALQLNGALRLTSELGRGTRAELWLCVRMKPPSVMRQHQTKRKPSLFAAGLQSY